MSKYFHELTDDKFRQAKKEHKKYLDFSQPSWCNYPEALDFSLGCWSLTERRIKSQNDCKFCECNKNNKSR